MTFGVELPLEKQIAIGDIRRGMPLGDLTSYELILMLNDGGWTWRPLTPQAKALSHDLVASPRELVWFSGVATQRAFLLALLKGPELHEQHGITLIPHYAKPKVYRDLLRGVAPQEGGLPVEDAAGLCQWLPDDGPLGWAQNSAAASVAPEERHGEEDAPQDDMSEGVGEDVENEPADALLDDDLFDEICGDADAQPPVGGDIVAHEALPEQPPPAAAGGEAFVRGASSGDASCSQRRREASKRHVHGIGGLLPPVVRRPWPSGKEAKMLASGGSSIGACKHGRGDISRSTSSCKTSARPLLMIPWTLC